MLEEKMKKVNTKICLGVASVHFILFMLAAIYIASIEDGQAPMLWALFHFIDYPVGYLIIIFGEPYTHWVDSITYPIPAIFSTRHILFME